MTTATSAQKNQPDGVGQTLLGTTWGGAAALTADHRNGRFAWFKEAKFGIFIHWGLYSLLEGEWKGQEYRGIAEWIMRVLKIPVKEYEALAKEFNPVHFHADAWLDLFEEAGAQYVTITAKHHDGFCLFNSGVSSFNSAAATPGGRDIIGEMSSACERHALRLCLYYSQDQDWHEPHGGGNDWDFPPEERHAEGRHRYVEEKVRPQLEELLTGYGPIGYFWFDTPGYLTLEEARSIRETVLGLQPECMSSSRLGYDLGDFESLPDQMVPETICGHRSETAMTHNDSWAYSKFDTHWKSPETLIRQLVETVSCGANYLLNIGPRSDGSIPEESVTALQRIGAWLRINGESIYGSGANPLGASLPWGVCTSKPGRIFAHVMNPPLDGRLLVPWSGAVSRVSLLATGEELTVHRRDDRLTIELPERLPDPVVTVLVLELASEVKIRPLLMPNQTNVFRATDARTGEGTTVKRLSWMHETFGNWHHRDAILFTAPSAAVHFSANAVADGRYRIFMEYDSAPVQEGYNRHTLNGPTSLEPTRREPGRGSLQAGGKSYAITLPLVTPGYFETKAVCEETVWIPAGEHEFVLTMEDKGAVEIVKLTLVPLKES